MLNILKNNIYRAKALPALNTHISSIHFAKTIRMFSATSVNNRNFSWVTKVGFNLKRVFAYILNYISDAATKIHNNMFRNDIKLSTPVYNKGGRYMSYYAKNVKLLGHYEILRLIFYALKQDESFLEFGSKKFVILSAIINNQIFSFHHNVLIQNSTTFEEYYGQIEDYINNLYSEGTSYEGDVDTVPMFEIMVWNADDDRNKKFKRPSVKPLTKSTTPAKTGGLSSLTLTIVLAMLAVISFFVGLPVGPSSGLGLPLLIGARINSPSVIIPHMMLKRTFGHLLPKPPEPKTKSGFIHPLKDSKVKLGKKSVLATMDIETITLKELDNIQIPICISTCTTYDHPGKVFTINYPAL